VGEADADEVVPVAMFFCDAYLNIQRSSKEASFLLGYREEELKNMNMLEIVHPQGRKGLINIHSQITKQFLASLPKSETLVSTVHPLVLDHMHPSALMTMAPSSLVITRNFRILLKSGLYGQYSLRIYPSGAFHSVSESQCYLALILVKHGSEFRHPSPINREASLKTKPTLFESRHFFSQRPYPSKLKKSDPGT